jgi:hypothetical protein
MSDEQSIFISHAAEDHKLAEAWQDLVSTISNGQQIPWYSGDKEARGGVGIEEWRKKISQTLYDAQHILVLLTPGSNERPWVLFESGIAYGQNKSVVPVVHFMDKTEAHDIFSAFELYDARKKEDVYKIIELMIFNRSVPEKSKRVWDGAYEEFCAQLSQERLATFTRNLFQDHFHNMEEAKKIEGVWTAKWIEIDSSGNEIPFEEDALYVWSTESRIRMVGLNTKMGIEDIMPGESGFYPMEGVVSGDGRISLSYWSAGAISICGTCLLSKKGSSGRKYNGYWQGYTTRDLDMDPELTRGRVELIKIGEKIVPPDQVRQIVKASKENAKE